MKKSWSPLRLLALMACCALFVYVVERAQPSVIIEKIRLLEWTFLFLILLGAARNALRAVAWSYCLEDSGSSLSWRQLFGPRLVGDALNDLMPAGPLFGEPTRIAVVSRLIPGQTAASSVAIEFLIYVAGAILFTLSGLALALFKLATPTALRWVAAGFGIFTILSVLFLSSMISRRVSLAGEVLGLMNRLRLGRNFLDRYGKSLRAVENDIYSFFLGHRKIFLVVLAIEFISNFTGVAESYLIFKATTAHSSIFASYLLECANRAVQLVFCFIPLGVGVQEGVAAAILQALGYGASEGVSLAIIRKLRILALDAFGLLFAAKYSFAPPVRQEQETI